MLIISATTLTTASSSLATLTVTGMVARHTTPEIDLVTLDGLAARLVRDASDTFAIRNQVLKPGGIGCAYFTGVSGTINLGNPSSIWNFSNQSFTIEAWVNPGSIAAGNYVIVGKSNNEHYALDRSGADYRFFCRTAAGFTTAVGASKAVVGTWTHVVGVISHTASTIEFYCDGVRQQSWSITGGPALSTDSTNLYIGSRNNQDRYWNGYIDEVRIYSTALTSAQIVALYAAGAGTYSSAQSGSLMAQYHLDEGSGVTAADATANARTGTLSGSVSYTTAVGKVLGLTTTVDATGVCLKDGTDSLEAGIHTFGDANGRAVLQGQTVRFLQGQTERARFDSSGNFALGITAGTSPFHIAQAQSVALRNLSSSGSFTMGSSDYALVYSASGVLTVSLPSATGCAGRVYELLNIGGGSIVIDPAGSETINGASTVTISTQYSSRRILSNGTVWYTLPGS